MLGTWGIARATLGLGGVLWLFATPTTPLKAACAPWGPCISVDRPTIGNDRPQREPRERPESSSEGSGAGCASTGSADYTPTEQRYPNLRRGNDGRIYPREGYAFANNDQNDYSVVRKRDGAPHERFANVVWTGDGNLRPAPGYRWFGGTYEEIRASGYRVELHPAETPHEIYPSVVWSGDGRHIRPAEGYAWTSSPPSSDGYRVAPLPEGSRHARYPNVIWAGDGRHIRPADGYIWASGTPGADGFRVVPRPPGSAHQRYPNVVWTGDGMHIRPAPGYRWTSPNNPAADGFQTVADASPPPPRAEAGRPDPSSSAPPGATPGRLQPFPLPGRVGVPDDKDPGRCFDTSCPGRTFQFVRAPQPPPLVAIPEKLLQHPEVARLAQEQAQAYQASETANAEFRRVEEAAKQGTASPNEVEKAREVAQTVVTKIEKIQEELKGTIRRIPVD